MVGVTRDLYSSLLTRAMVEAFRASAMDLGQHLAEGRARENDWPYSRAPEDSPWYEAEKFCADTLRWVENVQDAVNGREYDDD